MWNDTVHSYGIDIALRRVKTLYCKRDTNTQWIFERMDKYFHDAAEYFCLDIKDTSEEDIKIMSYEPGDHFNTWHRDVGRDHSALRKISMSVELSEYCSYQGGHLEIHPDAIGSSALVTHRGCGVAFPSGTLHRVTPVTAGRRFSLVNWIN